MYRLMASSLALTAVLSLAACGGDDSSDAASLSEQTATTAAGTATSAMSEEAGTIVDVARDAGDFTVLVQAVEAAGLGATLSGPGPFTVLAPTDKAFTEALASLNLTAAELLADKDRLTKILTYHVLPTEALAADVVKLDGQQVTTVNGAKITVDVSGSKVMVQNATVTATDVMASNGVIHVIDKVLLPPS